MKKVSVTDIWSLSVGIATASRGGWGVGTRRRVQLVELARVNNSAGLRFWTKTMPCTADGYVPFMKAAAAVLTGPW